MNFLTRNMSQVWHEWFNQQNYDDGRYEFKRMLEELERLPLLFGMLRERKLPKVHKQCSLSKEQPIPDNKLTCALGVNVIDCSILKSLEAYRAKRLKAPLARDVADDEMDRMKAATCCWHILQEASSGKRHVDTSEGYILDEGDKMFWNNVYESLSHEPEQGDSSES